MNRAMADVEFRLWSRDLSAMQRVHERIRVRALPSSHSSFRPLLE